MKLIFAIDPGNIDSAYAILDNQTLKPVDFNKVNNLELLDILDTWSNGFKPWDTITIEMVAHYGTGMPAGKEIFDTCVWIGRFIQLLKNKGIEVTLIYRKEEAVNLCNSVKAKDSNIIQALVDRFAYGVPNHGKGTKKNPGWFYGFHADVWQSYAVAVTFHDLYLKEGTYDE
jgi:hypothetical protein